MVERYNIYPYDQYSTDDRTSPTGAWVRYEDYEALEAQLAAARADAVATNFKNLIAWLQSDADNIHHLPANEVQQLREWIDHPAAASDSNTIAAIIKTAGGKKDE
jgi:hypothetical protein